MKTKVVEGIGSGKVEQDQNQTGRCEVPVCSSASCGYVSENSFRRTKEHGAYGWRGVSLVFLA